MWKYTSLFCFVLLLLVSCGGENTVHEHSDSVLPDTVANIEIPTLDIDGNIELLLPHKTIQSEYSNGTRTYTIQGLEETDTLFIRHAIVNVPCEECRFETQIWEGSKYVDVIRDTGFTPGKITRIPGSTLLRCSKFGTPEYSDLGFYLSVRQYHPVETGNKKFLFYLKLE